MMWAVTTASVLLVLALGSSNGEESAEAKWSKPMNGERRTDDWIPLIGDQIPQASARALNAPQKNHIHPYQQQQQQQDPNYSGQSFHQGPPQFSSSEEFDGKYIQQSVFPQHQQQQYVESRFPAGLLQQQLPPQFLNQQFAAPFGQQFTIGLRPPQFLGNIPSQNHFIAPPPPPPPPPPPVQQQTNIPDEQRYRPEPSTLVLPPNIPETPLPPKTLEQPPPKPPSSPVRFPNNEPKFSSLNGPGRVKDDKEEVQILYVPVETLKQRGRNNLAPPQPTIQQPEEPQKTLLLKYQPSNPSPLPPREKESKKFRHPIQPLKEQKPANHLKNYPDLNPILETAKPKTTPKPTPEYDSVKDTSQQQISTTRYDTPQEQYNPPPSTRWDSSLQYSAESGSASKEEEDISNYEKPRGDIYGSEYTQFPSTPKATTAGGLPREITQGHYHQQQQRQQQLQQPTQVYEDVSPSTTLPPPNQPPLSVYLETDSHAKIGDVLSLLKHSKTIPVLDTIGPDSPHVFVGPSNLKIPHGYVKYELPYLSSLDGNRVEKKVLQLPFFVAPLNFQPPPGYSKIPFPPPHIGSVVLSNSTPRTTLASNSGSYNDVPSQTVSPHLAQTTPYRDPYTIPADISSISPQLPSLVNSLQEEEQFSGSTVTPQLPPSEEITEPSTTTTHRRPTGGRRTNFRGSQRTHTTSAVASTTKATPTRRPVNQQRQRRPFTSRTQSRYNAIPTTSTTEENYPTQNYNANQDYSNFNAENDSRNIDKSIPYQPESELNYQDYPTQSTSDTINIDSNKNSFSDVPLKSKHSSKVTQPPLDDYQNQRSSSASSLYSEEYNTKPVQRNTFPVTENVTPSLLEQQDNLPRSESPRHLHNIPSSINEDYDKELESNQDYVPREEYNIEQKQYTGASQSRFHTSNDYSPSTKKITPQRTHYEYDPLPTDPTTIPTHHRFGDSPSLQFSNEKGLDEGISDYKSQINEDSRNSDLSSKVSSSFDDKHYTPKYQSPPSQSDYYYDPNPRPAQENIYDQPTRTTSSQYQPTYTTQYDIKPTSQTTSGAPLYTNIRQQVNEQSNPSQYHSSSVEEPAIHSNEQQSHNNEQEPITTLSHSGEHSTTGHRLFKTRARGQHHNDRKTTSSEYNEPQTTTHYYTPETTTSVPEKPVHTRIRGRVRGRTYSRPKTTTEPPNYPSTSSESRESVSQETYSSEKNHQPSYVASIESEKTSKSDEPISSNEYSAQTTTQYTPTEPITRAPHKKFSHSRTVARRPLRPSYTTSHTTTTTTSSPTSSGGRHFIRTRRPASLQTKLSTGRSRIRRPTTTTSTTTESATEPTKWTAPQTTKPYFAEDAKYDRVQSSYEEPHRSRVSNYDSSYANSPIADREEPIKDYRPSKQSYSNSEENYNSHNDNAKYLSNTRSTTPIYDEYEDSNSNYKSYPTTRKAVHSTPQYDEVSRNSFVTTPIYSDIDDGANVKIKSSQYSDAPPRHKAPISYEEEDQRYETTRKTPIHTTRSYDEVESDKQKSYEAPAKRIYSSSPSYVDSERVTIKPKSHDSPRRGHSYRQNESKLTLEDSYVPERKYSNHRHSSVTTPRSVTEKQKESDDFWNQAVTIQQSKSYEYEPDSPIFSTPGPVQRSTNKKSSSSQQEYNDYDDYFNYQDQGKAATSPDQSPFPSNDQQVTFTGLKALGEVGKDNQYPEKTTPEPVSSTTEKSISSSSFDEREDYRLKYDKTVQSQYDQDIPDQQDPVSSTTYATTEKLSTSKKPHKRRGMWVRVRVKKPKDVFETAESQSIGSLSNNALSTNTNEKSQKTNLWESKSPEKMNVSTPTEGAEATESTNTTTEHSQPSVMEQFQTTLTNMIKSYVMDSKKETTTTTTEATPEATTAPELPEATTTSISSTESVTFANTEPSITTQTEPIPFETTTPVPDVPTTSVEPKVIGTSTTTEISLETEICYRGRCVKTKRIKGKDDSDLMPIE